MFLKYSFNEMENVDLYSVGIRFEMKMAKWNSTDNDNFLKEENKNPMGNETRKTTNLNGVTKFSFPNTDTNTWNALEKVPENMYIG